MTALYRFFFEVMAIIGLLFCLTAGGFIAAGYDFELIHPHPPVHISALHGPLPSAMPPGPEADQISGTFIEVVSDSRGY